LEEILPLQEGPGANPLDERLERLANGEPERSGPWLLLPPLMLARGVNFGLSDAQELRFVERPSRGSRSTNR
jgi:hypothetical protein